MEAPRRRHFHVYWLALAFTVPALFCLAALPPAWLGKGRAPLWCAVLVVDLLALSWPLVRVRREADIYPPSRTLAFLVARRENRGRTLDVYCRDLLSPLGCGAPLAVRSGLYPVRGYNPLDSYRYKNYLRILSGTNLPSAPFEVVDGFPLTNRRLLDLLGVRYLLQPTEQPPPGEAWHVVLQDPEKPVSFNYPFHGMHVLPPYTVYENDQVMPRAFVVPRATPLPAGREREMLLATDFRSTVLVEGCDPADFPTGSGRLREARITRYEPNQVTVEVEGSQPGWLVLTGPWYPGWACTVDGQARPVYPGNYLFRTVPVPPGRHQVVFRFAPASYRLGRQITLGALFGLAGWALFVLVRRLRSKAVPPVARRRPHPAPRPCPRPGRPAMMPR